LNTEIFEALQVFADELRQKLNSGDSQSVWPEDQLKSPLELLLRSAGKSFNKFVIVRTESPNAPEDGEKSGGRVDAAISVGPTAHTTILTGHVELKAPGKGGDPTKLRDKRDKAQWGKFKKLPNLIYTDGREWSLQRTGTRVGRVFRLSGNPVLDGRDAVTIADAQQLELLLRSFLNWEPIVPKSSKQIADLLAPLCRLLRTEAKLALDNEESALSSLALEWRKYLFPGASSEVVADAYAQTFTYALLIARFEGAEPLTVEKAAEVLTVGHGLLGEVLGLLNNPSAHAEVRTSTDMILRVIAQIDPAAIIKKNADNPWLYFYEEFLAAYDPALRKQVGAYYTPVEVVRAQTQMVKSLLKQKFGKARGFADDGVVVLDPAVGTGTYPLGILESVADDIPKNAPAALPERLRQTVKNLYGIEYLIGPYSVAHLRLSRYLADHDVTSPEGEELLNILLADTLASHEDDAEGMLPEVFGYENISQERAEAKFLKVDTRVVVCMGNPPYLRGKKKNTDGSSTGGWVTMRREPQKETKVRDPSTRRLVADKGEPGIITDFINPAIDTGHGGDVKNLYNAYVYFWRWAMWKVLEQNVPDVSPEPGTHAKNGIISFITASSFLRGPGFVGMRQHMRSLFDEIWIVDLGGDNKGGRKTENVFSIETPVAITTGVRYGDPDPDTAAKVRYVDLADLTAKEKKAVLDRVTGIDHAEFEWRDCMGGWQDPFLPSENAEYLSWPALTDIFPWQTGGPQVKRTWPIGETKEVLSARWKALASPLEVGELGPHAHKNAEKLLARRASQLKESRDRKVKSTYPSLFSDKRLTALSAISASDPAPEMRKYTYRSFDRQWIIADGRVGDFMRPSLWKSHSKDQVYLTSMLTEVLGEGPAAVVAAEVPDLHHFRGSFGGRHVIPLWKDADGTLANVTEGLLKSVSDELGRDVTATELFSYCYGLLATPAFVSRFWEELTVPGPRIPITCDDSLFREVADFGRHLVFLHTYGERFAEGDDVLEEIPDGAAAYTKRISAASYPSAFSYNPATQILTVGDGEFSGVSPAVWAYSVSGLHIVDSWLGYRMKKRAGKSSGSPLDAIRPDVWPDLQGEELLDLLSIIEHTLEAHDEGTKLLERVVTSQLMAANDLPAPSSEERLPLTGEDEPMPDEDGGSQGDDG
jgi:hypothetical protein